MSPVRTRMALGTAAALAVVAAVIIFGQRGDPGRIVVEEIRVDRGPVEHVVHELGVLAPRDPVVAKAPFSARLQWVVEDGTWVEAGADLFILSDEEEIRRIAELRTQLLQARAELRLARLRRANGENLERPKLAAAERALALAELRRRLTDAQPVGGLELVRLAEALRLLAETTAAARREAEARQDAHQQSLDVYLSALDAWQANRDRQLRQQARLDELDAGGEEAGAEERARARVEAEAAFAAAAAEAGPLSAALEVARVAREVSQGPRDAAAVALATAESAEADLRFRAEVEKRGLAQARLELDERQAEVDLAETRRLREQVRVAVAAGSTANSELERMNDQLARHENALEVIRTRLRMARRPPDAQVLAEADAQLTQARTAAEDARAAYARAMDMLDQDLALKEAQAARLDVQIDRRSAGFPAVLETGIRFAERELNLLGPDEADERRLVEEQLARLRRAYEEASGAPPNVVKAPVAGLVRVQRQGDRQRQAGDQCWELDPMVEIFPPENMDVALRINEVDIRRLRLGVPARVIIPALDGLELAGEIVQVSGVGRDKFRRPEYAGKAGFADVVDFEARVRLDGTQGVGLRQGMAARVSIVLEHRDDVLRLPLAAVTRVDEGWEAEVPDGRRQRLVGTPAGPLWFAVDSGLAEGDAVVVRRTRNR